jgi:hypothetical protein
MACYVEERAHDIGCVASNNGIDLSEEATVRGFGLKAMV